MIKYENGEKEVIKTDSKKVNENVNLNSNQEENLYLKGKDDAITYYRGRKSGDIPTFAATVLTTPLLGLITAAIITSNEPSNENLNYPNYDLMKNSSYNRGYIEQAIKIKKKKVWSAFGIGAAFWFVLAIFISSS